MPEELSPSQAAARIGATTRSVQRWITSGRLPARRVGGRWRVASDAIDALVTNDDSPKAPPAASPRIRSVFIANRGEIVQRIGRTCHDLGLEWHAPPSDGSTGVNLLDIESVVRAAVASRADAVHPGFGFLAENAEFAEAVMAAGLIWIGPPPASIRTMGDKAAARRLAVSLGVPVLAGYDAPDQADATMLAAAERIGLPLLVKPAAGGGGKGMRIVRQLDRLPDALAAARREAGSAFGDERLILERLVEGARHVEVQVLFDQAGDGVALGERDCSIQRRHQKVLEEAPSPAVDETLRERLASAALILANAVAYVGAGTCEFLVDERRTFSFLEMNTRLQVEHPVTELVTGRDLVADQLRIADGQRLGLTSSAAGRTNGHAVEVRLYAEDAEDGFLPAVGRVEALRWPSGAGIRVDAGIAVGSEVGARFDPMLAKIIAWGPDRAAAVSRLAGALDETLVLGTVTNLRFLRWLVRQPVVLDGQARTDTLDRIWPPDDWANRIAIPDDAWAAAAQALAAPLAAADPWAGGWRLNAPRSVRLEADGVVRAIDLATAPPPPAPEAGPRPDAVRVGEAVHVDVAGRSVMFGLVASPDVDEAARGAARRHAPTELRTTDVVAPMPGSVLAVHGVVGQLVEAGDPLVTLEAMKMEHLVPAPIGGTVAEVLVRSADQVSRGQRLAIIEP